MKMALRLLFVTLVAAAGTGGVEFRLAEASGPDSGGAGSSVSQDPKAGDRKRKFSELARKSLHPGQNQGERSGGPPGQSILGISRQGLAGKGLKVENTGAPTQKKTQTLSPGAPGQPQTEASGAGTGAPDPNRRYRR